MQPGRASPRGLRSRALRPWRCPRRVRGCRCGCPAGRTAPPPPVRTATFPEIALVSLLGAPDLSGGRTLDGVRPVVPSMLSADPQPKGRAVGRRGLTLRWYPNAATSVCGDHAPSRMPFPLCLAVSSLASPTTHVLAASSAKCQPAPALAPAPASPSLSSPAPCPVRTASFTNDGFSGTHFTSAFASAT